MRVRGMGREGNRRERLTETDGLVALAAANIPDDLAEYRLLVATDDHGDLSFPCKC
jgi:hypothetical protein